MNKPQDFCRYFLKLTGMLCLFLSLNACKSTQPAIVKSPEKEAIEEPAIVEESEVKKKQEKSTIQEFAIPPLDIAEFRAAWIATVANINWPSKPGLNSEIQKNEALELLDFLEELNFNAVILQVRPQADALYQSDLEPWSYFLTGKSGKAPEPFYDPLEFWIAEAHKRGIELHVWLNPYRAHHTTGKEIGEKSIIKTNPELVNELKNGMWWMDPGSAKVQDHAAKVVLDIVKRYDIDAVHFDDYFYPYASYNGKKDFPDARSWQKYLDTGGDLSRSDWRRKNVNDFIDRIAGDIKSEKAYVKFGISPFGIWRPGFPKGISGMDQYEELYADAKLWLNKGWIDYFTPQLYWSTKKIGQSFPVLLGWWESENVVGRHVWPGINIGLEAEAENKGEIVSQIMISRGILQDDPGTVHWNIGLLKQNSELTIALKKGPYQKNALVPPSPWLDEELPEAPETKLDLEKEILKISWNHDDPTDIFRWVLYFKYSGEEWDYRILNSYSRNSELSIQKHGKKLEKVGMTAVDRTGNQSNFKFIDLSTVKMNENTF
ncbi:glycoside hydrolase family 10 protein [Christiangramia sabulilitoris]|uniref:Family 10 glycosylhydrolase n=1 Tax=Christiangramia sabulilitoris TaxID=2583991 RepID=A0A550I8V5_9FLAO|nr:family 10 glycosylhydrolase [Christiangramia sabulilitoris]TRO67404.1 family 10 glycosylhydrolase [Christiangramia sabulilitoris]